MTDYETFIHLLEKSGRIYSTDGNVVYVPASINGSGIAIFVFNRETGEIM